MLVTALHYIGVVLLTRYLHREAKAWLLANCDCETRAVYDENDVAEYLRAVEYSNRYIGRRLRARYYCLFPFCAVLAIAFFTLVGLYEQNRYEQQQYRCECECECNHTTTDTSISFVACPSLVPCVCQECPIVAPAVTPSISHVLGFSIRPCLAIAATAAPNTTNQPSYCYTGRLWHQPVIEQRHSYYIGESSTPNEPSRPYYVDYNKDYYFMMHATYLQSIEDGGDDTGTPRDVHMVRGPVIVKESWLKRRLVQRYNETGHGCICADQMGFSSENDIAFVWYNSHNTDNDDTTQWIVLVDPVQLTGAAPETKRVHTKVARSDGVTITMEHDNQITVAFTSPQFKFESDEEVATLLDYNNNMGRKEFIVLRRLQITQKNNLVRINIVLRGDEAICFTYCRHPSRHHHPAPL